MSTIRLALVLLVWCAPISAWSGAPKLRVPPGFVLEQVAAEPDTVFPMFGAFDDRGRLFVAESSGLDLYKEISALTRKCRIRVLEDPDEHGRFRKSTIFADKLVFPMGLAWRDGKLYVADPPDLIALEDTDGDGKADKRTVLLSGFGHRDNGSLHGLTFGPDGWLYLTLGDPDGFKLKRPDGTTMVGTTGALLRCRRDGSDVEALCSGFENLVEIAFTPRGEILGTVNWYQNPTGGLRDALVHLVPGGRYPRHAAKPAPLPFTGEPLPPAALFPAVALSGLMRYEGAAFPFEMRGNLFAAQHNSRKITRHILSPEGATFRAESRDFVTTDDPDCHPSDVFESADGSLYFIDTGAWYTQHCPTGQIRKAEWKGAIYRVRPREAPPLADPWGLRIDWERATARQLCELLKDTRPVVRDRAQRLLSLRGPDAIPELARLLKDPVLLKSKLHAVWALSARSDADSLKPLGDVVRDPDQRGELQAAAARALGLRRARDFETPIVALLRHENLSVRLAAAEALARCGSAAALPELLHALTLSPDRILEHALIFAIHHIADGPALATALEHANPRVQQAALLLLDQPPRAKGLVSADAVLARLASPDERLRKTALDVLQKHPEWAEPARDFLARRVANPSLTQEDEIALRELILAFQGQKTVQELVAQMLTQKKISIGRRIFLLETVAQSRLPKLPPSWRAALAQSLASGDSAVRRAAVQAAATLQIAALDDALAVLADNPRESVALRIDAQRAIVLRRPRLSADSFALLLAQLGPEVEPLARMAAAEVLGRAELTEMQVSRLLPIVRGDALISPAVLMPAFQRAVTDETGPAFADYLAVALKSGWRPNEKELAGVLAALPAGVRGQADSLRALWKATHEQQRARLVEFEPLLEGGDAARGRQIFFSKKAACATCHRIGNEGGLIGPDLTKVGAIRAGRDILESILLPSATIAQGYDPYLVVTKSGRSLTGVIASQTSDAVLLRDATGATTRLPRSDIDEMRRAAVSLMPEGLERQLTREEFRDLLGFLQRLK
jgi:putative membrane-bound dehydrogenase-like protein